MNKTAAGRQMPSRCIWVRVVFLPKHGVQGTCTQVSEDTIAQLRAGLKPLGLQDRRDWDRGLDPSFAHV